MKLRGIILSIAALLLVAIGAGALGYVYRGRQQQAALPPAPVKAERRILYYHDPMHPSYKSDKPGIAPDCGMDLVPVYSEAQEEHQPAEDEAGMPPPEGAFRISPEKQQLIGVQFGDVEVAPLSKTLRAVARLAYDESHIIRIHSKVEGWIDQVFADFTGKLVKKNQPLLTVYSPELVATQEEYLLALRGQDRLSSSPFQSVSSGSRALVEAARRRLELWDVSEAQIAELEKNRKPLRDVTLYSAQNGFVITRNAFEKQRITPETELYTIADLSTIWALADVYESEVPDIHLGQSAALTLTSFPGRSFTGKITYIYPQLEAATRTLKIRAEFPNAGFALKPDMYGNLEVRVDYGRKLAIPQEAVLDSGADQVVFVSRDGGFFEQRKVVLGGKVGNKAIVLEGLAAGERVVTSGNFLIDSESRMKMGDSGSKPAAEQHKHD